VSPLRPGRESTVWTSDRAVIGKLLTEVYIHPVGSFGDPLVVSFNALTEARLLLAILSQAAHLHMSHSAASLL
jgi:hypothetical protein